MLDDSLPHAYNCFGRPWRSSLFARHRRNLDQFVTGSQVWENLTWTLHGHYPVTECTEKFQKQAAWLRRKQPFQTSVYPHDAHFKCPLCRPEVIFALKTGILTRSTASEPIGTTMLRHADNVTNFLCPEEAIVENLVILLNSRRRVKLISPNQGESIPYC